MRANVAGLWHGEWRAVDQPLSQGRLVNDTTGPFPSRFARLGEQNDALWRNVMGGERVDAPRAPLLSSALDGGALERLLALAHTPLPGPPQFTAEQMLRMKAGLAGLLPAAPPVPELPQMPQWLKEYARRSGMVPPGGVP